MRFTNETDLTTGLLRSERDNDRIIGALVARARYRLPDGARVAGDAALRMDLDDMGAYGTLLPDDVMPRTGTDVIVLGDAVSAEPVAAMRVSLQVGPYDVGFDVVGDRVWEGAAGGLVPSAPTPFTRMPVVYHRAYGGCADGDYGPMPWPANPNGRGYYLRVGEAKGRPLPNLESRTAPVRRWDDRPDPVGVGPYPAEWALRTAKTVLVDADNEQVHIDPEGGLFDRAHPWLSGAAVTTGTLRLVGMSTEGAIDVVIPECPAEAVISVGAGSMVRPLALEEILIDLRPESARGPSVELTWRKMFSYTIVPFERREVRLVQRARAEVPNG